MCDWGSFLFFLVGQVLADKFDMGGKSEEQTLCLSLPDDTSPEVQVMEIPQGI